MNASEILEILNKCFLDTTYILIDVSTISKSLTTQWCDVCFFICKSSFMWHSYGEISLFIKKIRPILFYRLKVSVLTSVSSL